MDRQHFIWPTTGTGRDLADLLDAAAIAADNANGGGHVEAIKSYLRWGSDQTRMLRNRVSPADLARLVTTPRYWATVTAPYATESTASAITNELTACARALRDAAETVRNAADRWGSTDREYASLVLVDANFWIDPEQRFSKIDWHDRIASSKGPGHVVTDCEIRVVVPILVIDELDGLTHKRDIRPKVVGATKYIYDLLGGRTLGPVTIAEKQDGRGAVTIQLIFDPYRHERLPINDEEIIERTIALRDFIGIPPKQAFFLTYDTGAAFRAEHAGLMPRLLPTPPRS